MISVLSTKIITSEQKNKLFENGFSLTEFDFISIQYENFTLSSIGDLLLFTSQNAVKSVLLHPKNGLLKQIPTICVGEKTARLLIENNWKVVHYEDYAKKLCNYIKKNHQKNKITFFSGSMRRDVLPNFLKKNKIVYNEVEVYKTYLTSEKINNPKAAILFFSPSGVKSYIQKNKISDEICFCIGETTAEEALKHSSNCVICEKPTVDSLIEKCISYFHQ